MSRLVVILSALALGAMSLAPVADARSTERAYSDQQLFDALMFGLGPAVTLFPHLADLEVASDFDAPTLDVEARERYSAVRVAPLVRAGILDGDSSALRRFGSGIRSGNHVQVRDALDEASALTFAALTVIAERERWDEDVVAPQCGLVVGCVTLVVAIAWVGVTHVAAVAAYAWTWVGGANVEGSQLAMDSPVADIVLVARDTGLARHDV